jgi:hypothetical protein
MTSKILAFAALASIGAFALPAEAGGMGGGTNGGPGGTSGMAAGASQSGASAGQSGASAGQSGASGAGASQSGASAAARGAHAASAPAHSEGVHSAQAPSGAAHSTVTGSGHGATSAPPHMVTLHIGDAGGRKPAGESAPEAKAGETGPAMLHAPGHHESHGTSGGAPADKSAPDAKPGSTIKVVNQAKTGPNAKSDDDADDGHWHHGDHDGNWHHGDGDHDGDDMHHHHHHHVIPVFFFPIFAAAPVVIATEDETEFAPGDEDSFSITNETEGEMTVYDDGRQVCVLAPKAACSFDISGGHHEISVTAGSGARRSVYSGSSGGKMIVVGKDPGGMSPMTPMSPE